MPRADRHHAAPAAQPRGSGEHPRRKPSSSGASSTSRTCRPKRSMERGASLVAQGRLQDAQQCLSEAIVLARRIAARGVLAEACESLSKVLEQAGDYQKALALYKEFHSVREAELAGSRKHAATAAQLWLDFQDANRRASQFQERAESLAADHAALARKAKVLTEVSQQDPLTGLLNRRGLEARIDSLVAASDDNDVPLTVAADRRRSVQAHQRHVLACGRRCRPAPGRRGDPRPLPAGRPARALRRRRVPAGARRGGPRAGHARPAAPQAGERCAPLGQGSQGSQGDAVDRHCHEAARGTIAAAIAAADQALYQAKANGRDRIATKSVSLRRIAAAHARPAASASMSASVVANGIGARSPMSPRKRADDPTMRCGSPTRTNFGLTRISIACPVIAVELVDQRAHGGASLGAQVERSAHARMASAAVADTRRRPCARRESRARHRCCRARSPAPSRRSGARSSARGTARAARARVVERPHHDDRQRAREQPRHVLHRELAHGIVRSPAPAANPPTARTCRRSSRRWPCSAAGSRVARARALRATAAERASRRG